MEAPEDRRRCRCMIFIFLSKGYVAGNGLVARGEIHLPKRSVLLLKFKNGHNYTAPVIIAFRRPAVPNLP
jgi:hypothetical protein